MTYSFGNLVDPSFKNENLKNLLTVLHDDINKNIRIYLCKEKMISVNYLN